MKKYTILIVAIFISSIVSAQSTVGLINYQIGNEDGYVLFSPMTSTKTYLINKCGEKVHEWSNNAVMTEKAIQFIRSICVLLFFTSPIEIAAQKQSSAVTDLEIVFSHYAGSKIFQLDSGLYKNDLNQDFSITKFKYYIGNITLTTINGKAISFHDYYLIDEEKPKSKTLSLKNVPTGEYVSLRFNIGVDSIDNCSGAQSGALDPINGMFWTWNTGYIFMKLEGISSFSSSPSATLEYHIGGFKE
ncbi:MAG: MbnP family protein, partial [Candidatus Methylopumilus sp.]